MTSVNWVFVQHLCWMTAYRTQQDKYGVHCGFPQGKGSVPWAPRTFSSTSSKSSARSWKMSSSTRRRWVQISNFFFFFFLIFIKSHNMISSSSKNSFSASQICTCPTYWSSSPKRFSYPTHLMFSFILEKIIDCVCWRNRKSERNIRLEKYNWQMQEPSTVKSWSNAEFQCS